MKRLELLAVISQKQGLPIAKYYLNEIVKISQGFEIRLHSDKPETQISEGIGVAMILIHFAKQDTIAEFYLSVNGVQVPAQKIEGIPK